MERSMMDRALPEHIRNKVMQEHSERLDRLGRKVEGSKIDRQQVNRYTSRVASKRPKITTQ